MYNLDLRLQEARENKLGYLEFLSLLLQDEVLSREGNYFQKLIRAAGFGAVKTFEGPEKGSRSCFHNNNIFRSNRLYISVEIKDQTNELFLNTFPVQYRDCR